MFQRILYTSTAAPNLKLSDVYDLIRVSNNRNSNSGLTGGLLFLDGYFIQALEGGPYAVSERYEKISKDPRHFDLVLRKDERTSRLLFESDWMALRDGSEIDEETLAKHKYVAGLPIDQFPGDQVLAFLMDCFDRALV